MGVMVSIMVCLFMAVAAQAQLADTSKCTPVLLLIETQRDGSKPRIERCDVFQSVGVIQAIVAWPKGKANAKYGLPVYHLEILRETAGRWEQVLRIDKEVRNPFGYIGIDFIDPRASPIHWILLPKTARTMSEFRIVVTMSAPDGTPDKGGVPIEIGWNEALRRFEELDFDESSFLPEKRDVPTRHYE